MILLVYEIDRGLKLVFLGENNEGEFMKSLARLFCILGLLVSFSQSIMAQEGGDPLRVIRNLPSLFVTGHAEEIYTLKCGDEVKTFEFPEGTLKLRSMWTVERLIYNGYKPVIDKITFAWEFDNHITKDFGVLDLYGTDKQHPSIIVEVSKKFLEIDHYHGRHFIPLQMFFDHQVNAFGHDGSYFYADKNECNENMP